MPLNNHGICPLIRISGTQNLGLQALRKGTNLKSLNLKNPPYNSLLGIWTIAHVENLSFSSDVANAGFGRCLGILKRVPHNRGPISKNPWDLPKG